jgi:phospholipase C
MSMEKIEHVVLLMMENRSFDSLLGWLYDKKRPARNIPPLKPGEPDFDGRNVTRAQDYANVDPVSGLTEMPSGGAHGLGVPNVAPGEAFAEVNMQLFGKENPGPNDHPTMKGYVHDYANVLRKHGYTAEQIKACAGQVLQCYLPVQLPVLNGLAEHYAVCDRWFSSVPSQTNPNRAFALCGTSMGLVDNGFLEEDPRRGKIEQLVGYKLGDDRFKTKTIFNALEESHTTNWKIYGRSALLQTKISVGIDVLKGVRQAYPGLKELWEKVRDMVGWEALEYLRDCSTPEVTSDYTYRLFPEIARIPGAEKRFGTISEFHSAARAGQLPHFSYIEPDWTIAETGTGSTWMNSGGKQLLKILLFHQGNDYHPPGNLDAGENLVRQVYESLIANGQAWEKTLLLITFDEPVGSFDHVQPPESITPWGRIQVQTYQDGTKRVLPKGKMAKKNVPGTATADTEAGGFVLQHNFEFNRYGGRVPAIVVSPLVEKGTVFRSGTSVPFDHTSIIATVLKWRKIGFSAQDFGLRTSNAPSFDIAVTLTTPRTDEREVRFLKFGRRIGDPVRFYDRFYLRDSDGKYISGFKEDPVTLLSILGEDPTFTEYFPRMAKSPTFAFYFQSVHYRPWDAEIPADGVTQVRLVTTDPGVGAYTVLGQWSDAWEFCYYYNDYISGSNSDKETWILTKNDKSILRFGDKVTIVNKFDNRKLARTVDWGKNPDYLSTQLPVEYWTIEAVT